MKLSLVVALIIAVSVYAFVDTTSSVTGSGTTISEPIGNTTNSKYLEITNHSYTEDPLFTVIEGMVFNNSSSVINLASIHVEFYDDNDSLITIGSSTAKFPILNPGDNSSFTVRSELGGEDIDHYIVKPGGNLGP